MTIIPIENEVRLHTGISKTLKAKIKLISDTTKVPQSVVINTLLYKGLKNTEVTVTTTKK